MADLIGRHIETSFPSIQRSVGDVFRFSRSKYFVSGLLDVDVTKARETIANHQVVRGENLSFTAWIAKCLAQTISEFPEANSFRKGARRVITFEDVDVLIVVEKGVAADRRPLPYVIRQANLKTVVVIHNEIRRAQAGVFDNEVKAIREAASRDRKNILLRFKNPYSLPGFIRRWYWRGFRTNPFKAKRVMGTTGITAVGMFASGGGWPLAPGTHTVDLAVGGIARKPGVVGNAIAIRHFLGLSLQFDHEMIDGAPAARFASRLSQLLEGAFGLEGLARSARGALDMRREEMNRAGDALQLLDPAVVEADLSAGQDLANRS